MGREFKNEKSLRLLLLTGAAFTVPAFSSGANAISASNFSAEYIMNSALDVADDTGMEQVNFSHNAGMKKAQEYLHRITKDVRFMLRNMEKNTTNDDPADSDLGAGADSWGKAERIHIEISEKDTDTSNFGDNIEQNTSFNILFKFAKEHHVHHLDDVTFRFVPLISESQDGELSIQGWYCETDIDWVDFTRDWKEPAASGSEAAVGQAVKGEKSMVTRVLGYPFSGCTVAKNNIALSTGESDVAIGHALS